MPFYFDLQPTAGPGYTTNGAGNTLTDHILGIAAAAQGFGVRALYAGVKNSSTVGGGFARLTTGGTSAAGTAATPSKRHPNNPAASSTWSTAITSAGSPITRALAAFSQTGGQGGWMAWDADDAVTVLAGTTNKAEIFSITLTASQSLDLFPEFVEL